MSTPYNPKDPFDIQGLIGNKISEIARNEIGKGLMAGGAKHLGEAGLNMAKEVKLGDIISTLGKVFEDVTASNETASEPVRETPASPAPSTSETKSEKATTIPFTKTEEVPTSKSNPVEIKVTDDVKGDEAKGAFRPSVPKPESVEVTLEANENIDVIHSLSTSRLSSAEQEELVTAVMNLVRLSSPEGFTGEHVRWLSRLYGNKSI